MSLRNTLHPFGRCSAWYIWNCSDAESIITTDDDDSTIILVLKIKKEFFITLSAVPFSTWKLIDINITKHKDHLSSDSFSIMRKQSRARQGELHVSSKSIIFYSPWDFCNINSNIVPRVTLIAEIRWIGVDSSREVERGRVGLLPLAAILPANMGFSGRSKLSKWTHFQWPSMN